MWKLNIDVIWIEMLQYLLQACYHLQLFPRYYHLSLGEEAKWIDPNTKETISIGEAVACVGREFREGLWSEGECRQSSITTSLKIRLRSMHGVAQQSQQHKASQTLDVEACSIWFLNFSFPSSSEGFQTKFLICISQLSNWGWRCNWGMTLKN